MYVVDELIRNLPGVLNIPTAMTSLLSPVPIEQWHCWLMHCSPLTIVEMSKANLVDGLNLSGNELCGKCVDCIIGQQACRPYNGKSETNLDSLELVSFDL